MSETSSSEANGPLQRRKFTAFWPLAILLVTIITLQVQSIVRSYEQRTQIEANLVQLKQVQEEAKKVDMALGAVSRDLLTLSEKNTNALRVVTDFQIRQNQNATNSVK